ncbi:PLP-dependent aminotransferase family protein [Aliiroseovarius sp. KMU-50]|uniref:PLP-dependent aminotransferase family protein n=1 Tax=Aliiroseovarius salicola TaxID=3009082 RepID=A0ABT4W590_9RHOB|nr:PLP-dependent aminotransferase family protein [Aliiroseovarius sp. KMU-50]MDA5095685.1 PLP-dependent aminotransferase family protein [Aliiroseovarius sp. KMU-50]
MGTIFAETLLSGDGPKYRRLVTGVQQAIETGELPVGEKLPPVRDLAWKIGITPGTVARAYSILSDEGWVKTEVGRGTFVIGKPEVQTPARHPQQSSSQRPASQKATFQELALHKEPENDFLFAPRLPDVGQVQVIREAISAAAQLPDAMLLRYPFFEAQRHLRKTIHMDLPEDMRISADPDDVVVTNGGQNGIMLSMQTLLAEGSRVVMVEEHSYPGLRRAVELLGAEVVAVPMDAEGVDPKALDRIARDTDARLLFTMPEAHNPTCTVTSGARRHLVAEIARRRGFHVVQDDCYRLGAPVGPNYRSLLPEQGWFITSFSKTISPALRAGYVVAPNNWAGKLRRVVDVNYFGISAPAFETLYQVLTHPGLPKILTRMQEKNREYIEVALNVLGRFDLGWSHDVPFFWLRLPDGWRVSNFSQLAEAKGIRVRPGDDFSLRDGPAVHAVRISVNGQMPLDRFRAVLEEIARMLDHPPESLSA